MFASQLQWQRGRTSRRSPNLFLAVILFFGSFILSLASFCATYLKRPREHWWPVQCFAVTAHPEAGSMQPHDYISTPLVSITLMYQVRYQPLIALILDVNTLKFSPCCSKLRAAIEWLRTMCYDR